VLNLFERRLPHIHARKAFPMLFRQF